MTHLLGNKDKLCLSSLRTVRFTGLLAISALADRSRPEEVVEIQTFFSLALGNQEKLFSLSSDAVVKRDRKSVV